MSDYSNNDPDFVLPKDLFDPKGEKRKKSDDYCRVPEKVTLKMFLDEEDMEEEIPDAGEDPAVIDTSDGGSNTIPTDVLKHILEQTEYFEQLLYAYRGDKGFEMLQNAKKEFLGTAPSLIQCLVKRILYLQDLYGEDDEK